MLALACALSACAGGPKGAREGAALLAGYTIHIQKEAEAFAGFRAELARSRQVRMNRLEANAIATEQRNAGEIEAWRLVTVGKKDVEDPRVRLYEAIRRSTQSVLQQRIAGDQLGDERERALRETTTAVRVRSNKLGEVAKALANLARDPDLEAEAAFLGQFFGGVSQSIDRLKQKAADDAKAEQDDSEGSGQ
jgi:hypothetical protein